MPQTEATQLLERIREGDGRAWDDLVPLVYDELRDIAHRHLTKERSDHTLQTTALVHEAFLRLHPTQKSWQDRVHFLAAAAVAVRRVLVDHARHRGRIKRGGGRPLLPLHLADDLPCVQPDELLAIDAMIEDLGRLNDRHKRIVEMRYFGNMTIAEIAAALEVSVSTVEKDWAIARMWLQREYSDGTDDT